MSMVTPQNIETLIPEELRPLVFDFTLVFSRFEYALKRAGFINGTDHVRADWDKFGNEHDSTFTPGKSEELKAACDYFISHPPMRQISDHGTLRWDQTKRSEPFLAWILIMVRRVRNNLLHGGKYPMEPVAEPSRNKELITHSMTILNECFDLNPEVASQFSNFEE